MNPARRMDIEIAKTPDGLRIYAIGDVHGCADLLAELHSRIEQDMAKNPPKDWRIIHLGDFCDRGPDTKRVMEILVSRSADPRVLAVLGNHDEAWMAFQNKPDINLFTTHGGETTTRSYGVSADFTTAETRKQTRDAMAAAVPQSHFDYLRALPRSLSFGDYFFCHAGVRPGVPLAIQDREDLIWIRREFLDWTGLYEKVVIHGHTPVEQPDYRANRVNIDTGAVKSGTLTAIVLENVEKTFMAVKR